MSFSSIENKRVIWSTLVETAYFKGFPANQKDMVKRVLDSVVHEISQHPILSKETTIVKNREVVKMMMTYRDLWVQDGIITNTSDQENMPGYVSQVTAEELREQRETAFNQSLHNKQMEMEGYLKGNRPQDIDFSDKASETKIGSDMDRLIAEAEAQRKRQMEELFAGDLGHGDIKPYINKEAENWVNGGRPIKIDNTAILPIEAQTIESTRRVRFSDEPNINTNIKMNDDDIFSKLKRKQNQLQTQSQSKNQQIVAMSAVELQSWRERMEKMEKDIEKLIKLMTHNITSSKSEELTQND